MVINMKAIEKYIDNSVLAALVLVLLVLGVSNAASLNALNVKVDGFSGGVQADQGDSAPKQVAPQQPSQPQAQPSPSVQVGVDDDPVKGSASAPVTIIEFSDFQCPYCGRFFTDTLPQIEQNYIDTGKAKLIYRDFPLSFHPNAEPAAEAADCAGEQGKFWEMHDKLFGNQASLSDANYRQWAADLGLDTTQFNSCLDSKKYASEIQNDIQDGQAAGVSGTPTFFINGNKVVGAQPYSVFEQAIDAALGS